MAKTEGLDQFIVQLNTLSEMVQSEEVVKTAKNAWSIVGDQVRINASTMLQVRTGFLIDPRTILTHAGFTHRDGNKTVFAETGVFKDDKVMNSYPHPTLNRNRRATSGGTDGKADIPAPQIAWFLEFGVQPHYIVSGIRARKFPVTEDSKVGFHKGIAPTPFISSAFDTKLDEAYSHLIKGLDLLIEKSTS